MTGTSGTGSGGAATGGASGGGGDGGTGGGATGGAGGNDGSSSGNGGSSSGNGGSSSGNGGSSSGNGGSNTSGGGGASSGGAAGSGGSGGTFDICSEAPAKAVTIYMIGDSTMSVYASSSYPRMGWGQPLGDLFDAKCASVVDKALSGRSSKSFFNEGAWTPIKDTLKSGDYVLIQFGHNDEKEDQPALYTEPQTTYKEYLTTYVNDTRDKQAIPVLLTSIYRNYWDGNTPRDSHGEYPPAVRELARELEVDLIDLTALTGSYFERIGPTETAKLFLILARGESPNYPNGITDNTHLQETGARTIGRLAMADAYGQQLTLATLLKAVPSVP